MKEFILSGKQVILDLLRKTPEKIEVIWIQKNRVKNIKEIIKLCQSLKIRYQFVPKEKLDKLTTQNHQGLVAKVFEPGFFDEHQVTHVVKKANFPVLLALDEIQDQGNIGVLSRTLYGLGGAGIVIQKYRSAQLGERAFRSSAGALYHLPIFRPSNLKQLLSICQENNFKIYYAGTDPDTENLFEAKIDFPCVLVLGNEEKGVRDSVKKMCNNGLTIPMLGDFDSLNVAQAGAIFLGEFFRRWLIK